jgi:hypothetical protein
MKFLFSVVFAFLLVACSSAPRETGVLEGHVTIGPLVPVVREGEPTPGLEVYAAYPIIIYARDGKTEIARAQVDASGNFCVVLPVGTYVVDIVHRGIGGGKGLPREVLIASGQVTRVDVEIDTGIR